MTFGDQLLLESIRKSFVLMDLKLILVFSIIGTYSDYLDRCFHLQYIEKSWSSPRKLFKWLSFKRTFFVEVLKIWKLRTMDFSFVEYKWEKIYSVSNTFSQKKTLFFLTEIRKLCKWQSTSLFDFSLLSEETGLVELWVYRMILSIMFVTEG